MSTSASFSEREREVITLLLQGKSNKQIALALGVSRRTVEYHLSNIYSKLDVTSRTEAVLVLSKLDLRESTGEVLRESTVPETDESNENMGASNSTWRISVNKSFLIGLAILIATSVFCVGSIYQMAKERGAAEDVVVSSTNTPAPTLTVPPKTSTPTASSKEHILKQIRQLVAQYDQAVQSEKQHGDVEFSKDPNTGEEVFLFQGDSYMRIWNLKLEVDNQINELGNLYAQIYRDEINPTPFPTQSSPEQNQVYLTFLYDQAKNYCPTGDVDIHNATVVVYDPDDGKYHPRLINEEFARCLLYGQMLEEWRTAPMLAKINKEADMKLIRQAIGKPDLKLEFQSVSEVSNAPGRSAALYIDETGTKYYVDIETAHLAAIEPNFPGHPDIPSAETKSMDELRGIARQFASTNSPRLAELEKVLLYEENCKGAICFFRWDYRNKDWTGTDWAMMPPFLQVGVLANGQIATYNNTLDLFE